MPDSSGKPGEAAQRRFAPDLERIAGTKAHSRTIDDSPKLEKVTNLLYFNKLKESWQP